MATIESGSEHNKKEARKKLFTQIQDVQQYTLRIPTHLYKEVKLKLVKENKKLRPVMIEMLEKYIKT